MNNSEFTLSTGAAAHIVGVSPTTVLRWAASGRIASVILPSGHRRYRLAEIERIARGAS